ncbi:MAG TPA: hypothetical protein VKU19_34340 [Bryobacteraceae bacterium]|nr:hypothetical protein [Bryobacteraceae bacterium]
MSTAAIVVVVAVIVVLAIVAWVFYQKERSRKLRSHFGPEYERAFRQYGGVAKAEHALEARQKRMEKIKIHALSDEERDRFTDLWHGVQSRFVDDPRGTIREADRLVTEVMVARGYPMGEFDRRADDISVDFPHVVSNYRKAHDIAVADENGESSTEDLRNAVVCYRQLFEELLEGHVAHRR